MLQHRGFTRRNSVSPVLSTPCTTFQPQRKVMSQACIPRAVLHIHSGSAVFPDEMVSAAWEHVHKVRRAEGLNSASRSWSSSGGVLLLRRSTRTLSPLANNKTFKESFSSVTEQTRSRGARVARTEVYESHLCAASDTLPSTGGDPSAAASC